MRTVAVVPLRAQGNACPISCQMVSGRQNFASILFEDLPIPGLLFILFQLGLFVPYLLLGPLATVDARLDVGDGVDYVMRTALFHTPSSALALGGLFFGRQRRPLVERRRPTSLPLMARRWSTCRRSGLFNARDGVVNLTHDRTVVTPRFMVFCRHL